MPSSLKIIPTRTKHKKLSENWIEAKPVVIEGMNFTSKYIGMTLVDSPKGEDMAATAVKRIFTTNKASNKVPPPVQLTVSSKGIVVKDSSSQEVISNVDINRISFCTADKSIGKVFGYVAQNPETEAFECHAYLCGSRKEAQNLTLTVAHAFKIAYEITKGDNNVEETSLDSQMVESASSSLSIENKKISSIYRSITDSRYKRLSNSSLPSADVKETANDVNEVSADVTENNEDFVFDSGSPSTLSSSYPAKQTMPRAKKSCASDVVVSIMPPPSIKGKSSSRLKTASASASLIDASAKSPKPLQTPEEKDKIEFDFAELALSRTKESSS